MVKGHDIISLVQENKHIYSKKHFLSEWVGGKINWPGQLPPPGGEDNQGGG